MKEPRPCVICQELYTPRKIDQKTCQAPECNAEWKRVKAREYARRKRAKVAKPKVEKACPECSTIFMQKYSNQVCCCPECQYMRNRRNMRESKGTVECAKDPENKIREFTSTSTMMIVEDLEKGRSANWMADMYGRDVHDVQQHIDKILHDGTADKIRKRLAAYQENNTLKRRSRLL